MGNLSGGSVGTGSLGRGTFQPSARYPTVQGIPMSRSTVAFRIAKYLIIVPPWHSPKYPELEVCGANGACTSILTLEAGFSPLMVFLFLSNFAVTVPFVSHPFEYTRMDPYARWAAQVLCSVSRSRNGEGSRSSIHRLLVLRLWDTRMACPVRIHAEPNRYKKKRKKIRPGCMSSTT